MCSQIRFKYKLAVVSTLRGDSYTVADKIYHIVGGGRMQINHTCHGGTY